MKTKITKRSNNAWHWMVSQDGICLAVGWCKTETDAKNDAQVWIDRHTPLARLRHHVSGAIARGESEAITEKLA